MDKKYVSDYDTYLTLEIRDGPSEEELKERFLSHQPIEGDVWETDHAADDGDEDKDQHLGRFEIDIESLEEVEKGIFRLIGRVVPPDSLFGKLNTRIEIPEYYPDDEFGEVEVFLDD